MVKGEKIFSEQLLLTTPLAFLHSTTTSAFATAAAPETIFSHRCRYLLLVTTLSLPPTIIHGAISSSCPSFFSSPLPLPFSFTSSLLPLSFIQMVSTHTVCGYGKHTRIIPVLLMTGISIGDQDIKPSYKLFQHSSHFPGWRRSLLTNVCKMAEGAPPFQDGKAKFRRHSKLVKLSSIRPTYYESYS